MARRSRSDPEAPRLDRAAIVRGALELIDRDGFDVFSVRALAKHLGAGNMSVYWYIEDRETLLALVLDDVLGTISLHGLPDDPLDAVQELASRFIAGFSRHPGTVSLFVLRPIITIGPHGAALFDHLVGLLLDAGLPDDEVADATIALMDYLAGHLVGTLPAVSETDVPPSELLDRLLDQLPADAAANIRAVAPSLRRAIAATDATPGIALMVDSLRRRPH